MSFLKKIFGLGGASTPSVAINSEVEEMIQTQLESLITYLKMDLVFNIIPEEDHVLVELKGGDTDILTDKDGMLIDALQFYVKRVIQHNFADVRIELVFDTEGFREKSNAALIELAEKLKGIALERNKSVYFRALAPKDRKVVHQHLAQDERIKSKSVGDGLFKKIKVFPANFKGGQRKKNRGERPTSNA